MAKHRASTEKGVKPANDSRYHKVSAPKCPHGHYARYAVNHCKPCAKG